MSDTVNWLHHDHTEHEALLEDCREAAEQEDWKTAKQKFEQLVAGIKIHMRMEEEILYPAYESLTGTLQGPTTALKREHDEIVRLLKDLYDVVDTKNSDHLLESLLPLENAVRQHHEKEEEIFLPMASHALITKRDEIEQRIKEFESTEETRRWSF